MAAIMTSIFWENNCVATADVSDKHTLQDFLVYLDMWAAHFMLAAFLKSFSRPTWAV